MNYGCSVDKIATLEFDEYQKHKLEQPTAFNVDDILGRENVAHLILGSQVYILRKTRQNKLLLTK